MEYGGPHGFLPVALFEAVPGRDYRDHAHGLLVARCRILLSRCQCKDYFSLCLSRIGLKLSANPQVLRTVQSMGPGDAANRYSLSWHDLVIGNSVLGWSRVSLERSVLQKGSKGLTLRDYKKILNGKSRETLLAREIILAGTSGGNMISIFWALMPISFSNPCRANGDPYFFSEG